MRKLKKLLISPGIFFRDALINKYPLVLNQNDIAFNTEEVIIKNIDSINQAFAPDFPIDVVYTWVDSSDPIWSKKKNSYLSAETIDKYEMYATIESRYENHNELFYSLISIEKYLPWVNRIFIITDRQQPLIPESLIKKITFIDHIDIIPHQFLPTFNSHVIEAYLHRIEGLAEHFLYFNDDFFVARPLKPQHFFKSNKISSLFVSNKKIDIMSSYGRNTATLTACNNCNYLMQEKFSVSFNHTLVHTYVPLKKSAFELTFKSFEKEITIFSKNKFRASLDLNMATFMVPYMQYQLGLSVPSIDICSYFNIRSPSAKKHYDSLLATKNKDNAPHSFCANDFSSTEFQGMRYKKNLNDFLKNYFLNT
ncbi:MAG: stealth family protein [Enterobacterales bacterium endosymbiont of Blomia tropicalis]|uniref:stealth family protein n=1 Tax=Mixta mediterraneensis TaxID=2758443 RepID=UPI0025A891B9|nr:stealth family protein [Mixta mediterraneensis]MDL4912837.1 stealth family protein [Mixta mediterraneensis]